MKKLLAILLCLALMVVCIPAVFAEGGTPSADLENMVHNIPQDQTLSFEDGDILTLTEDLTLEQRGICLQSGSKLIVPQGITLTNLGWIDLDGGYLDIQGTYVDLAENGDWGGSLNFFPDSYGSLADATNVRPDQVDLEERADSFAALKASLTQDPEQPFRNIRTQLTAKVIMTEDLTLPEGRMLVMYGDSGLGIPEGKTLTIAPDATLNMADNTEITLDGSLVNSGTMIMWGNSSIDGIGEIQNDGYISAGGNANIYVPVNGNPVDTGRGEIACDEETMLQMLNEKGWVDVGGEITLTKDLRLQWQGINLVEGGKLIVPQGITLTNIGDIGLWGGYLEVQGTYTDRDSEDGSFGGISFHAGMYADYADATNLPVSKASYDYSTADVNEIQTALNRSVDPAFQEVRIAFDGQASLASDLVIPAGRTLALREWGAHLTVPAGKTLTISKGANLVLDNQTELTVNGTLINNGSLYAYGESVIDGTGEFQNNGFLDKMKSATISVAISVSEEAMREQLAQGNDYTLCGTLTLTKDLMFVDHALRLAEGGKLIVPKGVTLKNFGWIDFAGGYLDMQGTYVSQEGDYHGNLYFYTALYGDSIDSTKATNMSPKLINAEVDVATIADAVNAMRNPGNYPFLNTRINLKASGELTSDLTIPADFTLCIYENNGAICLTVPQGVTLTVAPGASLCVANYGDMTLHGTLVNNGDLNLWWYGDIYGDGSIENNGWIQLDDEGTSHIGVPINGNQPGQNPGAITTEDELRQALQNPEMEWLPVDGNITLTDDLVIPEGKRIGLNPGSALIVPKGITLTNNCGIHLEGGELTLLGEYIHQGDGYVTLVVDRYENDYTPVGLQDSDLSGYATTEDASQLEYWFTRLSSRGFANADVNLTRGNDDQTLARDLVIPEGVNFGLGTNLIVPAKYAVRIQGGMNVWDSGSVKLDGIVYVDGWLDVGGPITGSGKIVLNSNNLREYGENLIQVLIENPNAITNEAQLRAALKSDREWLDIDSKITVASNLTIPADKHINLQEGATLTISKAATLTNYGGIHMTGGLLKVNGKYVCRQGGYVVLIADIYDAAYVPTGLTKNDLNGWVEVRDAAELETWAEALDGRYGYSDIYLTDCVQPELNGDLIIPANICLNLDSTLVVPEKINLTIQEQGILSIWENGALELNGRMVNAGDTSLAGPIYGSGFLMRFDGAGSISGDSSLISTEIHTILDYVEAKDPTCGENGNIEHFTCDCGKAHNEYLDPVDDVVIPATGNHTPKVIPAQAATCTETGLTEGSKCSVCGEILEAQQSTPVIDHTPVPVAAVEPTCADTGLTEGSKCSVCGEILEKQEIIPATGAHTSVPTERVEPTCDKVGITEGTKCSVCGEVTSGCEEIPMIPHTVGELIPAAKATLSAEGYTADYYPCTVCGKRFADEECAEELTDVVVPAAKTVKLSATSYTYDGKVKSPTVTVTDADGNKLVKDTDYTVSYASGRKTVGSFKVTVKGKGNYSFTKTLTFKINPVKTAISKLTAGSKSFTVKWSKKTKEVSGYQIQYSLSKSFSSPKTLTIKGTSTVSKTVSKLKAAKTYYVRVRTYKTVGSTKYYSDWSSAKYIKTKK